MTTSSGAHDFSRDSGLPLYVQVADALRGRITKGDWKAGDILPSIDHLNKEMGVARVTVRDAIGILRDEGLLRPERGRGTLVTEKAKGHRPFRLETNLASLVDTLKSDRPDVENICEGYGVPDTRVFHGTLAPRYKHIQRVHLRDTVRYCVISLFIDDTIYRRDTAAFRTKLALPVLAGFPDIQIESARQSVRFGKCDTETSRHLNYQIGDPVAHISRVLTGADNHILYAAEVIYRADFLQIDMDLMP